MKFGRSCIHVSCFFKERDDDAALIVNEVRFLSSTQHPNIIKLLGTFCAQGQGGKRGMSTVSKVSWLLVLERCHGRLSDHVCSTGPLEGNAGQASSIALLSAVAHLHARQIIHRDIRPQNVLLRKTDGSETATTVSATSATSHLQPVLANFGLACAFDAVPARKVCTSYAAPEVLEGLGPEGPASDVFSSLPLWLLQG